MSNQEEKKENEKELESLLSSELEQIQGGACQCDTGAGQVIVRPRLDSFEDTQRP